MLSFCLLVVLTLSSSLSRVFVSTRSSFRPPFGLCAIVGILAILGDGVAQFAYGLRRYGERCLSEALRSIFSVFFFVSGSPWVPKLPKHFFRLYGSGLMATFCQHTMPFSTFLEPRRVFHFYIAGSMYSALLGILLCIRSMPCGAHQVKSITGCNMKFQGTIRMNK